jgi:hypothetical protein
VDVRTAHEVLGVGPTTPWTEVRTAYLRLVRRHHPDAARDVAEAGVRTVFTAQVTEAYAVLGRARSDEPAPARAPTTGPGPNGPKGASETRSVVLDAEQADAYFALLEVFHVVGVVSYVDRQQSVLETIVTPVPGQATSLLALLEPAPGHRTMVMLGVEPLGSHPPAALDPLVDEIARLLAAPRPPVSR